MSSKTDRQSNGQNSLKEVKEEKWGQVPDDNFGYSSDEERRAKRGLWRIGSCWKAFRGRKKAYPYGLSP